MTVQSFQPPHRTLRSWAYETLRERIIAGDLAPGEALVEANLAKEFGISRSPIREALRQLGHEGLVVTTPNSATVISSMDVFDINQIFEVRDLLESCLVAHAAAASSSDELADVSKALALMPALAAQEDIRGYAAIDVRFHQMLWDMAKRPRVTEALLPIADQARRYLNLSSRTLKSESAETLTASYKEHCEIFAAIEERDVPGAVAAIRNHMSSSRKRILLSMSRDEDGENPGYHLEVPQRLAYTITWMEGEL